MFYVIFFVMAVTVVFLTVKVCLMKKAAKEITSDFSKLLNSDTNAVIGISIRDKDMCELADSINAQLGEMRNKQLRYEQGNNELKTAVTNISHDLRTPLTAICGYLELMQNTDDPQKREHYLSIMKERADLMKQLTEELFRYSVIVSDDSDTETEKVFVNQVLAESISSFYPALRSKGIEPKIILTDKRIERNINKSALLRVFSNLLNNAVKYSSGDLEIALSDTGEITFTNTAKELSSAEVEQLFDRFYTVEAAHHSTGLGLSIARALVERMGGTITAVLKDERLTIKIIL